MKTKKQDGQILVELVKHLQELRRPYEATWQDICDYIYPAMGKFTVKNTPGTLLTGKLVDSFPTHSCNMLASWMQTIMTNSSTKWFLLKLYGVEDADYESDKWLDSADDIFRNQINDSNLDMCLYDIFRTMISLGTAVLYSSSSSDNPLKYQVINLNEIYLRNTYDSSVSSVYRVYKLSIKEAVEFFGKSKLSRSLRQSFNNNYVENTEKEIEIIHAVIPVNEFTTLGKKLDPEYKYRSIYMEKETEHVISSGGYFEMPYIVCRWSVEPGNVYGTGLGWQALPDIKILNRMVKTMMRAGEKAVDPPYGVPENKFTGVVKMNPGSFTYMRPGSQAVEPLFTAGNIAISHQMIQEQKHQIGQMFFYDQLQLLNKNQMTATEIMERSEEKMRLLSPIGGRVQIELLQPLVERSFHMVNRTGLLPQAPEHIGQQGLKVEYQSPIHKAQQVDSLMGLQKLFQVVAPYLELDPSAGMIFKLDEIIKLVADVLNVPVKVLRNKYELQKKQQEKMEQMEQQMQMEQAKMQNETQESDATVKLDKAKASKVRAV